MRKPHLILAATTLTVPLLALAAAGAVGATTPNGDYTASLEPLNQDAAGDVALHRHGDELDVHVRVTGLDGGVHLAHIHGIRQGLAECPTAALDTNNDGLVDFGEGLPAYGPVLRTLSNGTNDQGTSLDYTRSFQLLDNGDSIASLGDLSRYVVVIHGVDLDGDGLATKPDADGDGPGNADNEISMPALCGQITR